VADSKNKTEGNETKKKKICYSDTQKLCCFSATAQLSGRGGSSVLLPSCHGDMDRALVLFSSWIEEARHYAAHVEALVEREALERHELAVQRRQSL